MNEEKTKNKKVKNPILALILSAILPGLGQVYNWQIAKGLFFIGFNMIINYLIREPLLQFLDDPEGIDRPTMIVFIGYSLASMILWVYAMFDAKRNADLINSEAGKT